jgi:hypothetical protein
VWCGPKFAHKVPVTERNTRPASNIGARRQDGILKNRPQQGVRAKPLWFRVENRQQFRSGVGLSPGLPSAIRGSPQRNPRTGVLVEEKEQSGLRRNQYLGVIAGGSKLLIPIVDGHAQFISTHDCLAQHIATQSMEATGGSVHHHKPLSGKCMRNKLCKGLA